MAVAVLDLDEATCASTVEAVPATDPELSPHTNSGLVRDQRLSQSCIMTILPLSEAKNKLSAMIEQVETTHEIVTITRHGRPAAVLMAADDLESLHETLFWLSQPGVREDVIAARQEVQTGETTSGADLRAEFGLNG